ncbi:hypothetical protein GO009_17145 [Muricauda sp. TY007]|uniref:hypothetical protein n=1 Tax=Allomuricauda sp. TY007 TaxID=2683200 RepID=UPI0013C20034|nr:hypothetical protein [Muricauda sp. TY007]NDV17745.1 hypothetical protein [Muricauda sp. TY007]
MGIEAEGATENSPTRTSRKESFYQLADENDERTELVFHSEDVNAGLLYLDKSLEHGYPVLLGVNHTLKYRRHGVINEDTTDHYIVAVGRKCVNGQVHYIFWDVGTRYGAKKEWLLELKSDSSLVSVSNYRADGKAYTVTQIRRNKKKGEYIKF